MTLKKRILLLERRVPGLFSFFGFRRIFYQLRNVTIIARFLRVLILTPFAFLTALFGKQPMPFVMIATRDAHIGPCSLQLIDMLNATDRNLVLSVKGCHKFKKDCESLLDTGNFRVHDVVEQDSFAALCYAFQARVHIAFESVFETRVFANRWAVRSGRLQAPVRVPDGIVTKTNGNLIASTKIVGTGLKNWLIDRAATRITYVSQSGADNYRVCLNTGVRSPSLMRTVGLPRFLRAQNLIEGTAASIITPRLAEMFAADVADHRIMVALTKNKESSDLAYFLKQLDMPIADLRSMLQETNTSLWIKSHQSTFPLEDLAPTADVNSSERIFAVGTADGLSSIDLFHEFSGILTDISSIYVDFLPFDKPIGFVSFDSWKADGRFCYPDSPFYPGAKLNTIDDLQSYLRAIPHDIDEMEQEREYSRRVLLGSGTNQKFWSQLLAS